MPEPTASTESPQARKTTPKTREANPRRTTDRQPLPTSTPDPQKLLDAHLSLADAADAVFFFDVRIVGPGGAVGTARGCTSLPGFLSTERLGGLPEELESLLKLFIQTPMANALQVRVQEAKLAQQREEEEAARAFSASGFSQPKALDTPADDEETITAIAQHARSEPA